VKDATARSGTTPRTPRIGRMVLVVLAVAGAGALTACGSPAPAKSAPESQQSVAATPLATSLSTAQDSWAIVPMAANPAFWQVFVRPANSQSWRLVTPPGVADNGGLVAAGTGSSLIVAFRPSQGLTFSPLATSANGGAAWSTGLIDASVAATPGALAAAGSNLLALLGNGAIMASSNAGSTWRILAGAGGLAGSAAGKKCGALGVSDVSFGISEGEVLAAGTCGTAGAGVFAYSAGAWRQVSVPVSGHVVRMMPGLVLVANGERLYAAWDTASGWPVSAPLAAGSVVASGSLGPDGAWVLLPGRHAATIAGPGQPWRSLAVVPAGTSVLAAGPGGSVDALAVSGAKLTVWRLGGDGSDSSGDAGGGAGAGAATAWSAIQTISVPVQYGSSS
jgi:hypothetical protein